MTPSKALRRLLAARGIQKTADRLRVTAPTVRRWERDGIPKARRDDVKRAAARLAPAKPKKAKPKKRKPSKPSKRPAFVLSKRDIARIRREVQAEVRAEFEARERVRREERKRIEKAELERLERRRPERPPTQREAELESTVAELRAELNRQRAELEELKRVPPAERPLAERPPEKPAAPPVLKPKELRELINQLPPDERAEVLGLPPPKPKPRSLEEAVDEMRMRGGPIDEDEAHKLAELFEVPEREVYTLFFSPEVGDFAA